MTSHVVHGEKTGLYPITRKSRGLDAADLPYEFFVVIVAGLTFDFRHQRSFIVNPDAHDVYLTRLDAQFRQPSWSVFSESSLFRKFLTEKQCPSGIARSIHNGKNWAYAMRIFGSYAELNDCDVTGTQGGISPDGCVKMVINGGTYRTVNTPGKTDAFYAVYVTNGTELTINGGTFESPNVRTSLPIEGTSCVVSGDNDVHLEAGSIIVKGGKFSGKPYNHVTNQLIDPAQGFEWKSLDGPGLLKWEAFDPNLSE